jgi:hypothetical protein
VCLRAEVVRRGIRNQRRPDPLLRSRPGVALCEPEHGGEARQERTGDLRARPYVAPAAFELIGQHGDHLRVSHVLIEHLHRGAVAVTVNLQQHRLCGTVILLRGWAFRHRQLEADGEIQFLRIARGDAQPAPLPF